jgi:hypothetical protein
MKDKIDQEINVGDYIIYGHALGRCSGLRIGKVLNLKTDVDGFNRPIYRITVWGIDDDWQNYTPQLLNKKSTLLYPNRCVVVDKSKFSQKYLDLFDQIP